MTVERESRQVNTCSFRVGSIDFFLVDDGMGCFCLSRVLGDVYKRQIMNMWFQDKPVL